ncbi:caspase family protein [Spirulina sp. CS-785/01]|uniref:caspase family protein n=1 Tax=Spirulina sp. CS-785/01 TaxID=3021716 RepID=UPI00232CB277|nr:caspase family protein [Spirulina sp. CS-785/01]MDB9312548.1 caspase family protein [Spirulina sp. CS-785/01]
MAYLKRRHFLQLSAAALTTLGLHSLTLQRRATQYGKVLAQNTPRKLALLVGINQYPNSDRFDNLLGCVNDVTLQKYLLMHRFGFQDSDILTLTDAAASRQGIITAFEEHLIAQAKPGDVVVFHFSGHGSQVDTPTPIDPNYPYNSTFVPADSTISGNNTVADIMGQTLFLLMYALRQKTDNVAVILDSCHSGGGTRGEVLVRAAEAAQRVSEAEYAYQQTLLNRLNLTPEQFQGEREKGVATGAVLASTTREQLAADYNFGAFHAGAFSYLLTQYLWQQSNSTGDAIAILQKRIDDLATQQRPILDTRSDRNKPIYYLNPTQPPAEAAVLSVTGNQARVWLGGVNQESLDAFGPEAILVPVNRPEAGQVTLTQRSGLEAEATIEGNIQAGDLLQEYARAIPTDWQLGIGLDPTLGSDAATARRALTSLNRIKAIPSQSATEPYAQKVHYILSRMTPEYQQQLTPDSEKPSEGSIGLFSPALEVIPDSFGLAGESIEAAIQRLQPKLRALLATRIIRLTLNAQSSQLDVGVTMKLERSQTQVIGQSFTFRGEDCQEPTDCSHGGSRGNGELLLTRVPINEAFQFEVINNEDQALYLGVLVISSTGKITVLFPNEHQEDDNLENTTRVEAKSTLLIPNPQEDDFVLVSAETGTGEALVIASEKPMTEAFSRLRNLARGSRGPVTVDEPLSLITDFVRGVRSGEVASVRSRQEYERLRATQMATLSISFEVIPD